MNADPSTDAVLFEMRGRHVAIVRLNRPAKKNAVNAAVAQGMARIVDHVEADAEIRAVVLASTDASIFCAGADLSEIASGNAAGMMIPGAGFAGFTDKPRRTPWIAAVEGPALAGGCEIAIACDMIVAGSKASFGVPEVKRSLIAGGGGVHRLARLVPRNVALELLATGDPVSAERAYELGFVNRVAPAGEAIAAAIELAERIAANAPVAVQESLWAARHIFGRTDEDAYELVRAANRVVLASEDVKEGPRAFLEKRAPVWKGR